MWPPIYLYIIRIDIETKLVDRNCLNCRSLDVRAISPCYNVLLWSKFRFQQVTNKKVLEWFLLIMCKEHTLSVSTNLRRNHPTLCFWLRREDRQVKFIFRSQNLLIFFKNFRKKKFHEFLKFWGNFRKFILRNK